MSLNFPQIAYANNSDLVRLTAAYGRDVGSYVPDGSLRCSRRANGLTQNIVDGTIDKWRGETSRLSG